MNDGAYGCYPAYPAGRFTGRKRMSFRRYIARKKYGKDFSVQRFSYKKTRVGKAFKTGMTNTICTFTDSILIPASSAVYYFLAGLQVFNNLTVMLQGSPEFVTRQTQFSYYKLNGVSVTFTRQWIDPIAYGVNGVSAGFLATTYNDGLEMLSINLYPNLFSTGVGQPVEDADSSWKVSPFIHGAQKHYIPFPKNFTTGTNSNGLGVWNACSQISNLAGQFSIYNSGHGASCSDHGGVIIWDVEFNFYVQFCNNTGS